MTLFYEAAFGIYVVGILRKKQNNFRVSIYFYEVSRDTMRTVSYWKPFTMYETKLFSAFVSWKK